MSACGGGGGTAYCHCIEVRGHRTVNSPWGSRLAGCAAPQRSRTLSCPPLCLPERHNTTHQMGGRTGKRCTAYHRIGCQQALPSGLSSSWAVAAYLAQTCAAHATHERMRRGIEQDIGPKIVDSHLVCDEGRVNNHDVEGPSVRGRDLLGQVEVVKYEPRVLRPLLVELSR